MAGKHPRPQDTWDQSEVRRYQNSGFRCFTCNTPFRQQVEVDIPIEQWVANIKLIRCPSCGSNKLGMGENRTLQEDRVRRNGSSFDERVADWTVSGETGTSSKSIYAHFTGQTQERYPAPADTADVRRCVLLLDRVTEWKSRISEMAVYPGWAPLVDQWEIITTEMEHSEKCWSETAQDIFERMRS